MTLHIGHRFKWFIFSVIIAATFLVASSVWEAVLYVGGQPRALPAAFVKPLTPLKVDPSWIQSGTPNFRAAEISRSVDGRQMTGLWACDGPTTFVWTFGSDETVYLLEGRVEVNYLGKRFVLEPGDIATFWTGTQATWHVPSHAKKVFTLQRPGRLVLAWRRLVAHWQVPN